MPEKPVDIYVDTYQVGSTPYHGTINFSLTSALPGPPGQMPQADLLASVRMSLEALKLLAFMLARQITIHERNFGVTIQLPPQVLAALQIRLEDWETFWRSNER